MDLNDDGSAVVQAWNRLGILRRSKAPSTLPQHTTPTLYAVPQGDHDGAAHAYRAAISRRPRTAQLHYNLGNVLQA